MSMAEDSGMKDQDNIRFYHYTHKGMQFKTYELLVSQDGRIERPRDNLLSWACQNYNYL